MSRPVRTKRPEPWASLCGALALAASIAHADGPRGLVSPSTLAPASLPAGGTLRFVVQTATGLSPPPGVQEERAHRAFSTRLCARGIALSAPERSCFALSVRNVRPLESHSLGYRVEVPVPAWVAPGSYDLGVRFPGGSAEAPAAVQVGEPGIELWSPSRSLRVHLGEGVALAPAARRDAAFFPLPDDRGGFSGGVVALLPARAEPWVKAVEPSARRDATLRHVVAEAGQPVWLEARNLRAGARVFWWLGPGEGAVGARVSARFVARRPQPVAALVIAADGSAQRIDTAVPVRARRVGGCALTAPASGDVTGLLLVGLSWKLGRRRRGRDLGPSRARRE